MVASGAVVSITVADGATQVAAIATDDGGVFTVTVVATIATAVAGGGDVCGVGSGGGSDSGGVIIATKVVTVATNTNTTVATAREHTVRTRTASVILLLLTMVVVVLLLVKAFHVATVIGVLVRFGTGATVAASVLRVAGNDPTTSVVVVLVLVAL